MPGLVPNGELDAQRLLKQSWWTNEEGSDPLPVDPMRLAKGLGIRVEEQWLDPDESGRIAIPASGPVVITLNIFDHANRKRFTCAHEIGHYIHRRQDSQAGRKSFVDYRNTLAGLGVNKDEIYANQFAAALLMPAAAVKRELSRRQDPAQLAAKFGTSTQAFELRLRNLGLK